MSLERIDLNLFRVFEAILHERSVAGAARVLGVTPSAVSHALSRLRRALGDELFLQGEGGMEPNARALELAPSVRGGLTLLEDALASRPFVAEESARTFRISASDYGTAAILAGLIERLGGANPMLQLRIFPYSRVDVIRHLDEGRLDLVIGWFGELPPRMRRTHLLVEKEAVVVRPGHPLTEGPVALERLLEFQYVVVEATGTEDQPSDGFIDERGVWRRVWIDRLLLENSAKDKDVVGHVAVSLPHYAAVPEILAATDMVATLPERLARRAMDNGTLVILDLPYEPLNVDVEAVWHQRAERDSGVQWLLKELVTTVQAS
jgi:DNA-binding transcriptional LysR family regulator